MSTHRPTAPDWSVVLLAPVRMRCTAGVPGSEVARPARVEKGLQRSSSSTNPSKKWLRFVEVFTAQPKGVYHQKCSECWSRSFALKKLASMQDTTTSSVTAVNIQGGQRGQSSTGDYRGDSTKSTTKSSTGSSAKRCTRSTGSARHTAPAAVGRSASGSQSKLGPNSGDANKGYYRHPKTGEIGYYPHDNYERARSMGLA